jgi:hypothetical protein
MDPNDETKKARMNLESLFGAQQINQPVYPYNRPFEQINSATNFTPLHAVRELLQNHVDAARLISAVQGGLPHDYLDIKREDSSWILQDKGSGYSDIWLQYQISGKNQVDAEVLRNIVLVGQKGSGSKLAATVLEMQGIDVTFRSRDWAMAGFPHAVSDDSLRDFLNGIGQQGNSIHLLGMLATEGLESIEGSRTYLSGVTSELADWLAHPERLFLDFMPADFKPAYKTSNFSIFHPQTDSILWLDRSQVWIRGAYVTENPHLMFSYDLNSLRAPVDEERNRINDTDLSSAVFSILKQMDDPGIIEEIIKRGFEHTGDSFLEWSLLRKNYLPDSVKQLYKQAFFKLFKEEGRRAPVIADVSYSGSKIRLQNTLTSLNARSVRLNPELARFLHEDCGIEYDSNLVQNYGDLLFLSANDMPTNGQTRLISDIYLRTHEKLHLEGDTSVGVRSAMSLIEFGRRYGGSVNRQIRLLVGENGREEWISVSDYAHYLNQHQLTATDTTEQLFGNKNDFTLPDMIAGIRKNDYFSHIKAVRIDFPVGKGLSIKHLGEVAAADEDMIDSVPGLVDRLTDDQSNALDLMNRALVSSVQEGQSVLVRYGTWLAQPRKQLIAGGSRIGLNVVLGLNEDEDLKGKGAIIVSTKDHSDILNLVFNLPRYVLHMNAGYKPLASTDSCEIVSNENGHMFVGGYYVKSDAQGMLFSYNLKSADPLSWHRDDFRWNEIPGVILANTNSGVFETIVKEGLGNATSNKTEVRDYGVWAKERGITLPDTFKSGMQAALDAVVPHNKGKKIVIASGRAPMPEKGEAGYGRITLNEGGRSISQIIDVDSLSARTNDYKGLAEALGYHVVNVANASLEATLRACGVEEDFQVISKAVRYAKAPLPKSSGYSGPSAPYKPSAPMPQIDIPPSREKMAKDLLGVISGVMKETSPRKFNLHTFDHVADVNGNVLGDYVKYASVQTAPGVFDIYINSDQLYGADEKLFFNNVFNIAIDDAAAQDVAREYVYRSIRGMQIDGYGKKTWHDVFGLIKEVAKGGKR